MTRRSPAPPFTFGKSPYLTTDEAADYLRQPSRAAFRMYAKRHGLTLLKRGRRVLVDRREIDAILKAKESRA